MFDFEAYCTTDEDAKRWVREAREAAVRERTGYFTAAQLDKQASGIAGGWAEGWNGSSDELVVDSDEAAVREAAPRYERIEKAWREGKLSSFTYSDRMWLVLVETGVDAETAELECRRTSVESVTQDRSLSRWLRRDELEERREAKRRTEGDQHRVEGDYWGAGPAAEKRWLDAALGQLRVEARELMRDGRSKGFRVTKDDPQVQALARQAASLRHRHNFKRYVEALKCDPEQGGSDFAEAFEAAQRWRKVSKLSYAAATTKLKAVHERRWITGAEGWIGVEGLIAA